MIRESRDDGIFLEVKEKGVIDIVEVSSMSKGE